MVAGTVGPIGFLGLQVGYGLEALFGNPDGFATHVTATHATVIAGFVGLHTISAITGMNKGIQILSRINIALAAVLLGFTVLAGPTHFIFSNFFSGLAAYVGNFLRLAL